MSVPAVMVQKNTWLVNPDRLPEIFRRGTEFPSPVIPLHVTRMMRAAAISSIGEILPFSVDTKAA